MARRTPAEAVDQKKNAPPTSCFENPIVIGAARRTVAGIVDLSRASKVTVAVAPSGASFYRGQQFTQFANNLFVGTLRGTHLLRLRVDPASRRLVGQERLLEGQFGRIRDVGSGPDGYLYFCTNNRDGRGNPVSGDDRIARLVPAS